MKNIFFLSITFFILNGKAKAQNYNFDFENWDMAVTPTGDSLNGWTLNGGYKTADAHSGDYALLIHQWYNWNPAHAVLGESSGDFFFPQSPGRCLIPLTQRIYGLSGYYKYILNDSLNSNRKAMLLISTFKNSANGDSAIELTADTLIFSPISEYAKFNLDIKYNDTLEIPDFIQVRFHAGNTDFGQGGCISADCYFLYLDDLEFHDQPNGNTSVHFPKMTKKNIKIYPNPSKEIINVKYKDLKIKNISLIELSGKVLKTYTKTFDHIDINGIAKGTYFIRINTENGYINEKVIID